jgi:hypothetical protein
VPNWWEPLLDQSQPAWAGMISGPTSMSALGFLGPPPTEEAVELDMWGNPVDKTEEAKTEEARAQPTDGASASTDTQPAALRADALEPPELCELEEVEVCDIVDCTDATIKDLAAQLERSLLLDGVGLCDVVSCDDVPRECVDTDTDENAATDDDEDGTLD